MNPKRNIKNKTSLFNKLSFQIKQTKFFNFVTKLYRSSRSTFNFSKLQPKSKSKGKFPIRVIVLSFLAIVFIVFIIFNVNKYFSITPKTYIDNDKSGSLVILPDPKEYNVVYLGFDDRKPDYKFIDYIVLTSINAKTGELKMYGINPYFLSDFGNSEYPLRTAYNLIDNSNGDKMTRIMKKIQDLVGVRVDRYIAFNYNDLGKLIDLMNIQLKAPTSKKTQTQFFSQDEYLAGSDLVNYLIDNDVTDDNAVERYVLFISTYFENLRNTPYLYASFIKSNDLLNIMYTNLSKDDLIKFYTSLNTASTVVRSGYMSTDYTSNPPKKIQDGIEPSDLLVDEDVSKVFSNIAIIKEQAKLEVYNSSEEQGAAFKKKRIYSNLGNTVIKLGNYPDIINDNTLFIPKNNPDQFVNTIKMIQNDLRGNVKIIVGEYKYNYAGDMILVIGKNNTN